MAKTAKITDVAEHVVKMTGLSQKQAKDSIKATFESVSKLLKSNDRVTITGVGTFAKSTRPAQKGGKKAINPFTKEEYITKNKPAVTRVKFRPGKGFKSGFGG